MSTEKILPKKVGDAKNIEELAERLSPERQKYLSFLSEKKWFKKTEFETQRKVFTLPEDFNGFLNDFSIRKDEYGGMDVIKLLDVLPANYNLITLFLVRSQKTNQEFTYEYVASKYGKNPGYRGLILLEVRGEIKYFILRYTDKFPVGMSVFETIGTYIQFQGGRLVNMPKTIEDILKRELAMNDLVIKRFIDLGMMTTDAAVTSTSVSLYTAVIDVTDSPNLGKIEKRVFHAKPIEYKILIEPIEKIREYIHKVDESFFLACVLRLVSMGVITL